MKPFSPSKKRLIEIGILLPFAGIFYLFYPAVEGVALFASGYIWNWAAVQELDPIYDQRQYRYSMLRTIRNIQGLFLKPFLKAPELVQRFVKVFPAGIFWAMIVFINQSIMPWWATFLGSLAFELLQLEKKILYVEKAKDNP